LRTLEWSLLGAFLIYLTKHEILMDNDYAQCALDPDGADPPIAAVAALAAWVSGTSVLLMEGVNAASGACP